MRGDGADVPWTVPACDAIVESGQLSAGMNRQAESGGDSVFVEPGGPRPVTILRAAEDLERRGAKILELFEKVESYKGEVALPIHYFDGGEECFAEVEAGPWDDAAVERVLMAAAVLRSSEQAGARLDLFSVYPAPGEVRFLIRRVPAALLQLDLFHTEDGDPEFLAESFRAAASRHWGVDLDYDPGCLPLAEDLLLAALNEDERIEGPAPISGPLVRGLGCYVGEMARRDAEVTGSWRTVSGRGREYVLDLDETTLDPIGKARSFLRGAGKDSISRYLDHTLGNVSR